MRSEALSWTLALAATMFVACAEAVDDRGAFRAWAPPQPAAPFVAQANALPPSGAFEPAAPVPTSPAPTASAATSIHDNEIHDNGAGGVALNWQMIHSGMSGIACLGACTTGPACDGDTSQALMHNVVQSNQIYMCTGVTGELGARSAAQRSNTFSGNAHNVADVAGTFWKNPTLEKWDAWQSANNDVTARVSRRAHSRDPLSVGAKALV